jgi:SAM-dependent methyltransferase
VADSLLALAPPDAPLRILDAGGGQSPLADFLPRHGVWVLDRIPAPGAERFLLGDVTALPFPDRTFDYAVSVDLYEHLAPGQRVGCLQELKRVSRLGVIVAAPFASADVQEAEAAASDFYRLLHGQEHLWLREHLENGLPALEETVDLLRKTGASVVALPNGYLPRWRLLILAQMLAQGGDLEQRQYAALCRLYNEHGYLHDNREPCYRYAIVATEDPSHLARLRSRPPAPPDPQTDALLAQLAATALPWVATQAEVRHRLEQLTQQRDVLTHEADVSRHEADVLRRHGDAWEREAARLRESLETIQSGVGWRLLSECHRLRLAVLPRGSDRERAYLAMTRRIAALLSRGARDR